MSGNFIAVLVAASLGQFPTGYPAGGYPAPSYPAPGYPAGPAAGATAGPGSSQYGGGAVYSAPDSTQAFGTGDPTNPYDFEPNWAHGYYQEIPAYGGYHFFRPYNYKHVMPQSQVAAAWGISPNMPYSHQYFDRVSGNQTVYNGRPSYGARPKRSLNSQFAEIDNGIRLTPARRTAGPTLTGNRGPSIQPAGHVEK